MPRRARHQRTRRSSVLLIGTVLALVVAGCSNGDEVAEDRSRPAAPGASGEVSPFIHRPVDRAAPEFTLLDTESRFVSLSDFAGRWVVMDWVFTNCVDFCPLLTADMGNAYRLLGDEVGDRVQFVTISFDPTRDSPAQMESYAAQVGGLRQGWTWLTGDEEQTDAVASAYGVSFVEAEPVDGVQQFDHTSLMVVIGPDGRERHRYLGTGWSEDVAARLSEEIAAGPQFDIASDYAITEETTTTTEPVSTGVDLDSELLSEAIVLPWEEFELEDGVTSQVLYQFPNVGTRARFVESLLEPAHARGEETRRIVLSAMNVHQVPTADGGHFGVADSQNLAVVIEGSDWDSVFYAFTLLDSEWCCGTP